MMNRFLLLLSIILVIGSCKKDDGTDPVIVPPRSMAEVAAEDDAEIRAYLETHFYNYEDFDTPPAGFDFKIIIDTIAGANADKTPLIDQVQTMVLEASSSDFGLDDGEEDVPHTFYYLDARTGVGEFPTVADSTFVRYNGMLLNGTLFDSAATNGVWWDLPGDFTPANPGLLNGVVSGMVNFRAGGNIVDNGDGTFSVEDFGAGLIIIPSGLGYFLNSRSGIPSYSPLIFEVNLLVQNQADHDRDGIPSILEDIDGDGNVKNDNTDEDFETLFIPNYVDIDDDQDGTLTRDEISDENGNIIIPYPDTDGDGTPDYLDRDNS
ncbi:MAG: FKBP-type peptidyl-prolyl cis-trans isomerase [Flavobacteriaceae bacterium]